MIKHEVATSVDANHAHKKSKREATTPSNANLIAVAKLW
jgi:hypothetical protein